MGFVSYTLDLEDNVYVLKLNFKKWGVWMKTETCKCDSMKEVENTLREYIDIPCDKNQFSDEDYEIVVLDSEIDKSQDNIPAKRKNLRRNRRKNRRKKRT